MASVMRIAPSALGLQSSKSQRFGGWPAKPTRSLKTTLGTKWGPAGSIIRAGGPPVPLPNEYGYVVLTGAASYVLTQWQAIQVGIQRRKYGVQYPKMYEDTEPSVFNCYQRAHQNTLEAYSAYLALLFAGGLAYPITSSAFGMLWIVGRVLYSLGYYTGEPKNRVKGAFHFFGLLGLFGTCVVFGIRQSGLLPP